MPTTSAFTARTDKALVRIEQDSYKSMAVTCVWPRQTEYWERHDPDNECGWTWPSWDEAEMYGHAWSHLREEQ